MKKVSKGVIEKTLELWASTDRRKAKLSEMDDKAKRELYDRLIDKS